MRPSFQELFPFPLDSFQLDAMEAIDDDQNVIVCAPTGSGKTAIAEFAVYRAIEDGRRCFYTTPLKALSNQKFHDFRALLGEDKVGLLTGDVSTNRDAAVCVMTTEVYRNMLYGTSLGAVERNLYGVQSVILDECHYMNDPDRGTVWEESIIYSPREVQLVALSATIANAEDLRQWMSHTHAPTLLIWSDFRPVPLQHYYFFKGNLHLLINEEGRFNPKLRQAAMAAKVVRGKMPRNKKPENDSTPDAVVEELQKRDLLPAIYFVFSRRGCELAMQSCRSVVKLTDIEEDELADAIESAVKDTPSLADNPHLDFLYQGLAVHHAGLLPAWKALVERLYQKGLIKVVFATETLAAGINMPARTTVISALSKYTGEGHRLLTASEFLQMSGRAGRRGMDAKGYVVIVHHPKESAHAAYRLARAEADPLESNFRPSYPMVLNLLQRYSLDQCQELVERSFGQFLLQNASASPRQERLTEELRRLSQPLCPDRPGDLAHFNKLNKKWESLHRQSQAMGKAPKNPAVRREIERMRAQRDELSSEISASPCYDCPQMRPCSENRERMYEVEAALRRDFPSGRSNAQAPYWRQFRSLIKVLQELDYLDGHKPTAWGEMAAALRATHVLLISEVIRYGVLDHLTVGQLAAVLATLVNDETRSTEQLRLKPSRSVKEAMREVQPLLERLRKVEAKHRIEFPIVVVPALAGLVERWAEGWTWEELVDASGMESGDIVRVFRRIIDISRQLVHAPHVPQHLAQASRDIELVLSRDEMRESLLNLELGFDM